MFLFLPENRKQLKKVLFLSVGFAVLTAVLFVIFCVDFRKKDFAEFGGEKYSTVVTDINDMKKLADTFGIEVEKEPFKTEKIIIPVKFNEVYNRYNKLQNDIGLDLTEYKGEKCIKYSFNTKDDKILTLIIYNERFIGGDLSEKEFDGKMTSLVQK